MRRFMLTTLAAIGVVSALFVTASSTMQQATEAGMQDAVPLFLVGLLEVVNIAGTWTWITDTRRHVRVEAAVGVGLASTVTGICGALTYGALGLVAPVGLLAAVHLVSRMWTSSPKPTGSTSPGEVDTSDPAPDLPAKRRPTGSEQVIADPDLMDPDPVTWPDLDPADLLDLDRLTGSVDPADPGPDLIAAPDVDPPGWGDRTRVQVGPDIDADPGPDPAIPQVKRGTGLTDDEIAEQVRTWTDPVTRAALKSEFGVGTGRASRLLEITRQEVK